MTRPSITELEPETPGRAMPRPGWFVGLTYGMNSLGTFWVFCLMFLICADVIGRYVFNAPIRGVAEMVGYSIVTAVFLQFANTLYIGKFTRADVLIGMLKARRPFAGHVYEMSYTLVGAAMFALVAWGTWPRFERAFASDEITGVPAIFTFVIWPFLAIILAGAVVTAVEFLFQFVGAGVAAISALRSGEAPAGWLFVAALVAFVVAVWLIGTSGLGNVQIATLGIAAMLVLIYAGMPIGIVLILVGFTGIWLMRGDPALGIRVLSRTSSEYLNSYFFGVVPLFVLMGLLISVADVGRDMFDVARWMLRRVRGGLGVATVLANAVFASVTGSSIASAAVFTRIATPEMLRFGYTPRFSVGVVAGSSILGMLIPPSLLLIIYGFLAEQSVGHLFLAAIVPGLVLTFAMVLLIVGLATFWPRFVGGRQPEAAGGESVTSAAAKLLPIVLLIGLVLGGIYGGIFTPTEAGAVGAAGALLIALARRKLGWGNLWQAVVETGHVTVSILFLILAARIFGQMLTLSGLPQAMSALAIDANFGLYGFVFLFVAIVIALGTILDPVSIMVITLPFTLPVVGHLGGDLIWFGIITVVSVEIGLLTPPLGLTCYVVKSTLDDDRVPLNQIFVGAFPFVVVMTAVVALLVLVPGISLVF
jgi:tripartite ATP-independent transporter DctM subunit